MNCAAWVAHELAATGQTAFGFFDESWNVVHGVACGSNRIVIDANNYRRRGVVPYYVARRYELLKKTSASIPIQAMHSRYAGAYHKCVDTDSLKLVSEASPVLHAHKGKDGVWRC